jgi:hypothetical protein
MNSRRPTELLSALLPPGEVSPCQRNGSFKRLQVERDVWWPYPQKVSLNVDAAGHFCGMDGVLPQGFSELGNGSAQVGTDVRLVAVWPQKLRQPPPRVPPPLGGQVAQEREHLLHLVPYGQLPKARLRRSEQPEAQQVFFSGLRLGSRAPRFRYVPLLRWLVYVQQGAPA